MGDALSQTPYAQASPCRLPERRLLPTLHKFIFVFHFYILSREGCLQDTGGAWASAHFLFLPPPLSPIMGDALSQTPYAQASPCRLPERRLLPTLASPLELAFFVGVLEACIERRRIIAVETSQA